MNSSFIIQLTSSGKNSSRVYKDLDSAFSDLGFYFSIEMLYLTIYLALSVVGIVGNLFSMYIFYRPIFYSPTSPPLFAYMRYEALIGFIGNLVGAIYGLNTCADILPLTNTYTSQWIQSFISVPVYNMTYYAKFLIEIMIVVDRIIMLAPSLGSRFGLSKLHHIKRPYIVFIIICTFCVLINYPFIYLMFSPSTNVLVNYGYPGYQVYTYFVASRSTWSNLGMFGYYPMLFIYIFKNIVTFFFETVLNIISLVLFRRHLAQKNKLQAAKMGTGTVNRGRVSVISTAQHQTHFSNSVTYQATSANESTGGRNMANLVLVNTITGFVHNVLLTTFTIYNLNYPKPSLTQRTIQFSSYFASTVRHALNFVQFYSFNTTFRKETQLSLRKLKCFSRVRVQQSSYR
jgi:hypothetical protein